MNLFAIYTSVCDIISLFGTTAKIILYGRLATTVSFYISSTLCIIFQKNQRAACGSQATVWPHLVYDIMKESWCGKYLHVIAPKRSCLNYIYTCQN